MGCSMNKPSMLMPPTTRQYSISFDDEHVPTTTNSSVNTQNDDPLLPNKIDSEPKSHYSTSSPKTVTRPQSTTAAANGHGHGYGTHVYVNEGEYRDSGANGMNGHLSSTSHLFSPSFDHPPNLLNKDDYIIESLIQEGAIGKVYAARNKITNQEYALKFFGYTNIDPEERDIEHEIHAMHSFQGIAGIVQMIGFFYDTTTGIIPGKIYCNAYPVIVMELLTGGEVFETIHQQIHITEYILSKIFYQILLSVQSIHLKKYIHRDIKLENMMFSSLHDGVIKIIDFGLMVKVGGGNGGGSGSGGAGSGGGDDGGGDCGDGVYHDEGLVGTPGYLAPESIDYFDYSYSSDLWSLGCCLYSMLSGLLPFNPSSSQSYVHHRYRPMTGPAWVNISSEAKDLVKQLLQRSTQARYTLNQTLSHPWLETAPTTDLGEEYLSRMRYLAIKQKMKSFFLNSNQILDSNKRSRDQLKKIIPLLRKESSSVISRSSSGGSINTLMTPSPLKPYGYIFHSNSTLSSLSPQKKNTTPTPPTLKLSQKYKSTPPGGTGAGTGTGGGGGVHHSPYIKEKITAQTRPPIRPHLQHSQQQRGTPTPPPVTQHLPPPPSLKSSHSLDFLGRQSETNSPIKPMSNMSENELQIRLQSFKRSVLSSLLQSTSTHSLQSSSTPLDNTQSNNNSNNTSIPRYTINKETFLCLMLDAGLPELASSRVFHIFDTDNNGVLDIKEFLLTMLAFQSRSPRKKKQKRRYPHDSTQTHTQTQPHTHTQTRKFYRSKKFPNKQATLDDIDEMKMDVMEVHAYSRPSPLPPLPPPPPPRHPSSSSVTSSSSSSLVYQDIMNASPSPLPYSNEEEKRDPMMYGSTISIQISNSSLVDYDSNLETTNSSPEKRFDQVISRHNHHDNDRSPDHGEGEDAYERGGGEEEDMDEEDHLARLYFDIFDLDGNGSIEKEELRVAVNAFFLDEILVPMDPHIGYTPMANGASFGSFSIITPPPEEPLPPHGLDSHDSIHALNSTSGSSFFQQNGGGGGGGGGSGSSSVVGSGGGVGPKRRVSQRQLFSSSSPESSSKDIEELFQSIDSNQTGKITFEEWKIFFKKIRRSQSDSTVDENNPTVDHELIL